MYDVDCAPALFLTAGPGASPEDLAVVRERLDFPTFSGTYTDQVRVSQPGLAAGGEDPSSRWAVPRVVGTRSTLPAVLTQDGTTVRYHPRYRSGRVRSSADPRATALLVDRGAVAWAPLSCRPCRVRS